MEKIKFWIIGIILLIFAGIYKYLDFPYFNIVGGIVATLIAILVVYSTINKTK
ncbi:hypothetical protein HOD75_04280 [archaeon]|jgi:hypothetical protein|nr:hypothetical protein [archaeon]MBT4242081.1 hypothetical protein [archaeon]MBT4417769.1 hypothetical protein [archaeon]